MTLDQAMAKATQLYDEAAAEAFERGVRSFEEAGFSPDEIAEVMSSGQCDTAEVRQQHMVQIRAWLEHGGEALQ